MLLVQMLLAAEIALQLAAYTFVLLLPSGCQATTTIINNIVNNDNY